MSFRKLVSLFETLASSDKTEGAGANRVGRRPRTSRFESLENRSLLSVSGMAFVDVDYDGVYTQEVDQPLAGVQLEISGLEGVGAEAVEVYETQVTDENGLYTFDVGEGSYDLFLNDPPAPVDVLHWEARTVVVDASGVATFQDALGNPSTGDFSFWDITLGAYEDLNSNGVQDAGEALATSMPDLQVDFLGNSIGGFAIGDTARVLAGDYTVVGTFVGDLATTWAPQELTLSSGTTTLDIPMQPLVPTDVTVTTTSLDVASDGLLSLPEALSIAELNAGTTINFDSAIADASDNIVIATDAEIAIPDQTTISGATAALDGATVILDAGGTHRIFSVGSDMTATLESITLQNGDAGSSNGGALLVDGGTVALTDVVVESSTAHRGGGLAVVADGSLSVVDSQFTSNTASYGGGIYVTGAASSVAFLAGGDSALVGNQATAHGGGIYANRGAACTLDGTVLIDGGGVVNAANGGAVAGANDGTIVTVVGDAKLVGNNINGLYGGAIYVFQGADLLVGGNAMIGDGTTAGINRGGQGGGVCAQDEGSIVKLTDNAQLNLNVASVGGGAAISAGADLVMNGNAAILGDGGVTRNGLVYAGGLAVSGGGSTAVIGQLGEGNPVFQGNETRFRGGAIWATDGAELTVNSGTFSENNAMLGGAITVDDGATAVINGGSFTNNTATRGGAIAVEGLVDVVDTLTINASVFTDNYATLGGALHVGLEAQVSVGGVAVEGTPVTQFIGNSAANFGGALYVKEGASVVVTDDVLIDGDGINNAANGGAIGILDANSHVTVEGSVKIVNHRLTGYYGGAVYVGKGASATIQGDASIGDGTAAGANHAAIGGAVFATQNAAVTLAGNAALNHNLAGNGGGVGLRGGADLVMSDAASILGDGINRNASNYGGGIWLSGTGTTVTMGGTSSITSSYAKYRGGAVFAEDNASFTINESATIENNLVDFYGGGLHGFSGATFVVNSGVADNNSGATGGDVYLSGATLQAVTGAATISGLDHEPGVGEAYDAVFGEANITWL